MEVDQIQYELRGSNNGDGKIGSAKLGQDQDMEYPDEEEDTEHRRDTPDVNAFDGGIGRFYGWPSSRIVRVSRASGGKDRHSKVLTSKGLRDRRVRLSVNTAIQFYDLQDRLGYDQPSKAVEWLLKAAASSIAELPPMNPPFPVTPKEVSDERRSSTAAGSDMDGGGGAAADPSSPSETSKGSSRSETGTRARERAKGRVAGKEKEKGDEAYCNTSSFGHHMNQAASFTDLLNGRQWSSPPMEYFTNGFSPGAAGGGGSSELHHFSFGVDNYGGGNGGENNLSFSISSANSAGIFSGYNRGTLQSNVSSPSPSFLRFSPAEGSHQNFLMGGSAAATAENHHHHQQFLHGFDSRYNGQKGKGKN